MTVAWVFPGQGSQKIGMAKQIENLPNTKERFSYCLLYTSPSPRDLAQSRMPSSA